MRNNHIDSQNHILNYQNLLYALRNSKEHVHIKLYTRLLRCNGTDWRGRFYCRSPACPRCRDHYIARQRRDIQTHFQDVGNSELVLVTIILGGCQNTWDIGRIVEKGRRDLRNLVNRHRRTSPLWNDFEIVGWLETDAYDPSDLCLLGSDKSRQLTELISDGMKLDRPIWVPTIHAIARIPSEIKRKDVRSIFSKQWGAHHQTDIRSFYFDRSTDSNISSVVNYANKSEKMTGPAGLRVPWNTSWQANFHTWMHQYSRGFRSLKIKIGSSTTSPSSVSILMKKSGSALG